MASRESDEPRDAMPEGNDEDAPPPARRRGVRRRFVLRGGRPVEITAGPERETR